MKTGRSRTEFEFRSHRTQLRIIVIITALNTIVVALQVTGWWRRIEERENREGLAFRFGLEIMAECRRARGEGRARLFSRKLL